MTETLRRAVRTRSKAKAPDTAPARQDGPGSAPQTDGTETSDAAARKRRVIPWGEIRSTYEQSATPVAVIARAYGIRERAIYERAAREGWTGRKLQSGLTPFERPLDRTVLVSRLFHAVERQIAEIERRFVELAGSGADEKDARTLAALARTLELLIGLERQAKPEMDAAPETDIDEIRRDLARRIANMQRTAAD